MLNAISLEAVESYTLKKKSVALSNSLTHNTFSESKILAKFAKVSLAYNKFAQKEIEKI